MASRNTSAAVLAVVASSVHPAPNTSTGSTATAPLNVTSPAHTRAALRSRPAAAAAPSWWNSSAVNTKAGRSAVQANDSSSRASAAATSGTQIGTETTKARRPSPVRALRPIGSGSSRTPPSTSSHPTGSASRSKSPTRAKSAMMTNPIATVCSGFTSEP